MRAANGVQCTYCGSLQPEPIKVSATAIRSAVHDVLREDRNQNGVPDALEPAPPPFAPALRNPTPFAEPPAPVTPGARWAIVGAAASLMGLLTMTVFGLRSRAAEPTSRAEPRPVIATATATPIPTIEPTPTSTISVTPTALPTAKPAAAPPAKKLTNEQWAQSVVAAQKTRLLGCMEQDLLRNPNVPKAYSVTVHVESDGTPLNSMTTFSPAATRGFTSCARNVIFYGFNDARSRPPAPGAFTFGASFAFPNAKPAAKAETGRGWD